MITAIPCDQFLKLPYPILDVRSQGEYDGGHIIASHNLPLLNNENRHLIGICYKQKGKEAAIEMGYALINPLRSEILQQADALSNKQPIGIYCARGGLRSNKMAEFLLEKGYEVYVLKGGYKAYRNHILNHIASFQNIMILAGNTGCGKTEILEELQQKGEQVLDLESLARHKGSAFGALGQQTQPCTAQFANLIYQAIASYDPSKRLWVESESITIGKVGIPIELWQNMQTANGIEIAIPLEQRIQHIVASYGKFESTLLKQSIMKLERRLGGKDTRDLCDMVDENRLSEAVERLLKYYDKAYNSSKFQKNCQNYVKFSFEKIDPVVNSRLLLQHLQ
ncbi:MAG: tRNA 2-selenouridine(34) synthase MnmH [Bacteroidota bacterium]